MSYCSTLGFIESVADPSSLDSETSIRLISLFDHEEIGSRTAQGADSQLLPGIIRRLSVLGSPKHDAETTAYEQSLAASFLVSADMAHSVNPNYSGKYESDHKPEMNKGPVIKVNANARYATNSPGIVLLQNIAQTARVPLQLFVSSAIVVASFLHKIFSARYLTPLLPSLIQALEWESFSSDCLRKHYTQHCFCDPVSSIERDADSEK